MAKASLMKEPRVAAPLVNDDQRPLGVFGIAVQWDPIEDNKATAAPPRRRGMFAKFAEAVGIGKPSKEGTPADLDIAAVAFDKNHRALGICYFGNMKALGGALRHTGDALTGADEGWDETIVADLNHDDMARIAYLVPVLMAFKPGVNLGAVNNVVFATLDGAEKTSPVAGYKFPVEVNAGYNALLLCLYFRKDDDTWEGVSLEKPVQINVVMGQDPKAAIAEACKAGLPAAA